MIEVSRRQFLQGSVALPGAFGLHAFGFDAEAASVEVGELKILGHRGADGLPVLRGGLLDDRLPGRGRGAERPAMSHIEGDPDSPVNGGTLCPKGASTLQLAVNQNGRSPSTGRRAAPSGRTSSGTRRSTASPAT